jgi:hypothetical protein
VQLSGKPSLRSALTAATAALIGSGIAHAADETRLESSLLLYSEIDRVQAAEGIFKVTRTLEGGRLLSGRLTLDGLTGPSPNGATPSNHIQTFTRPSGNGGYSTRPGETPLDDSFHDSRFSLDGSLTQPLDRLTTLVIGSHLSTEHDYTSLGANVGLSRDFNRRNTTLSASAAFSHDLVRPEGGIPVPLSSMGAFTEQEGEGEGEADDDFEGTSGRSDRSKNVFDAVFGLTQVLDRQMLVRFNYSFNHSSGYLNDPYKLLSIVQSRSGTDPGEPVDYIYESRPDNRSKHALYAEVRRYVHGHTVNLSYRYFWDSWGIKSNTVDLRYRLPLSAGHALEPHVRWYRQSAADFYRSYLVDGSSVPAHASADYRLAPFHALTVGLQYLFPVAPKTQFSIGAEFYYQAGDLSPPESFGPLSQFDLFPDMKAVMVRAGFSYDL